MGATVSMWLGIAFLGLGIAATLLQAWLWRFPMAPDPGGPDPHGRSTAPRSLTNLHRIVGATFVVIYAIMMVQMVPRLWEYQVELPARTIIHACMGITIGFLLVTKIAIIRWFQHFGKALPMIGATIMLCTLLLSFLSVPYALRAHDFGSAETPANLERVARLLAPIDLGRPTSELLTSAGLEHGREVLTNQCVVCHDLRTILRRPYTPEGWRDVVWRMAEKPQIQRPLREADLAPVTAYLVAITPDIQQSVRMKRASQEKSGAPEASATGQPTPAAEFAAAAALDLSVPATLSKAQATYEKQCSACHELSDTDKVAPKSEAYWKDLVHRMNSENEAGISAPDATLIIAYLAATKGPAKP